MTRFSSRSFLVVAVGLLTAAPAFAAYPDVPTDHAQVRAIEYMQSEGIMEGYPNGTFGPELALNRAELMKILVEAKIGKPDVARFGNCFPDVTDEWFAPYVCYAASQGWVEGYPNGTFQPSRTVNAVEAVKMLVESRGYEIERFDWQPYGNEWFAPYVETAMHRGIGVTDDRKDFDKPYVRQLVARMMYVALMSEGMLQFSFPVNECAKRDIVTVEVAYELDDAGANLHLQNFIGVDADGGTCVLARDVNPRSGVAMNSPVFGLFPILPRVDTDAETRYDDAPIVSGKAYFLSACECDGGSPDDRWEYDIQKGTLSSFHAGIDLVTTDYRYFIERTEQKIVVFDRVFRREATVAEVAWPSTFIRENFGPGMGGGDYLELGAMTIDGTTLSYEVYDARTHGKDDTAAYVLSGVPTVDIKALFP